MDAPKIDAEEIREWLMTRIAKILDRPADELDGNAHFTSLGLDSLSLLTLTGDLASWLNRDLAVPLLVRCPTINSLTEYLAWQDDAVGRQVIPRAPRNGPMPVTISQARVLGHAKMGPEGDHNIVMQRRRLSGALSLTALQWALDQVLRRHEVLRTTYTMQDGEVMQVIHAPEKSPLEITDLSAREDAEAEALRLLQEARRQPMDLQKGPLFRVLLIRVKADDHRLVTQIHHSLCDAEAYRIFNDDLRTFHDAFLQGEEDPMPEPALQLADVAVWQKQWLRRDGPTFQSGLEWWQRQWSGDLPPPVDLPFRWESTPSPAPKPADCLLDEAISPSLLEQLTRVARENAATLSTIFLAAFAVILQRQTRKDDLVIGSYVSGRTRPETRRLMGVFVNMTPLRLRLHGASSFRDVLLHTRDVFEEAMQHRELSMEDLRTGLGDNGTQSPDVRVIFQYVPVSPGDLQLLGLKVDRWSTDVLRMPWGFNLQVRKRPSSAHVAADGNLYNPEGVKEFLREYAALLHAVAANPKLPLQSASVEMESA